MTTVDRHAYRVGVRARAELYHQALATIPLNHLPADDVQRSLTPLRSDCIYYKVADSAIEHARARAVWYCSYVAAGSYALGEDFDACVVNEKYAARTDRRYIGFTADGRVVATARALAADERGRFQIHDPAAGFGRLVLPEGSWYGTHLPETSAEIAATREVSAFAVDLDARSWSRTALLGIIKTVLNDFQDTGIRYAYSSIDESFFLLVNHMGLRLERIGANRVYMGGVTVPAYFEPDGMIAALKGKNDALYEFMCSREPPAPSSKYAFYRRVAPGNSSIGGV